MPPLKQARHRVVDDDDTGGGLPIMLFPSDSESDTETIAEKYVEPSRAVDRREVGRQDEEDLQRQQERVEEHVEEGNATTTAMNDNNNNKPERLEKLGKDNKEKEREAANVPSAPRHPIPAMQDAFAESLVEATQGSLGLKPKLRTGDAKSRREELLDQDKSAGPPVARWRARPGQKCHELRRLLAQISFGVYLLLSGMANSQISVVTILQGHIDEVDEFLETTLEDMGLATRDLTQRIRHLELPMNNVQVFETMLEDRRFRLQIVEGNEKIEHIVARTQTALDQAMNDIREGRRATAEFARYLAGQEDGAWRDEQPDVIDIFEAMRGNTEGWSHAFGELETKGNLLEAIILKLNNIVAEIERRAGEVSRRTRFSVAPFSNPADSSPRQSLRRQHTPQHSPRSSVDSAASPRSDFTTSSPHRSIIPSTPPRLSLRLSTLPKSPDFSTGSYFDIPIVTEAPAEVPDVQVQVRLEEGGEEKVEEQEEETEKGKEKTEKEKEEKKEEEPEKEAKIVEEEQEENEEKQDEKEEEVVVVVDEGSILIIPPPARNPARLSSARIPKIQTPDEIIIPDEKRRNSQEDDEEEEEKEENADEEDKAKAEVEDEGDATSDEDEGDKGEEKAEADEEEESPLYILQPRTYTPQPPAPMPSPRIVDEKPKSRPVPSAAAEARPVSRQTRQEEKPRSSVMAGEQSFRPESPRQRLEAPMLRPDSLRPESPRMRAGGASPRPATREQQHKPWAASPERRAESPRPRVTSQAPPRFETGRPKLEESRSAPALVSAAQAQAQAQASAAARPERELQTQGRQRASLRDRISLKTTPPSSILVPPPNALEFQRPSFPSPQKYQDPDSAYGSDVERSQGGGGGGGHHHGGNGFREPSSPLADLSPPAPRPTLIPSPHSDQQHFRPVQASPHSPLQQRPHTAAGGSPGMMMMPHHHSPQQQQQQHHLRNIPGSPTPSSTSTATAYQYQQHTRNAPSRLGGMSMLSQVTTMTHESGTTVGAGGRRGLGGGSGQNSGQNGQNGQTGGLKKKRSAFGWLRKAFTLDEEERAAFEQRRQEQQRNLYYDTRSPQFLDGKRIQPRY